MRKKIYGIIAGIISAAMLMTACGTSTTETASTDTVVSETVTADTDMTDASTEETETSEEDSYVSKLFDTSYVHTIDIEISEEDWADLLENPTDKTKYQVSVTIDGETIEDVSFATKGNTSLSSIADDDTTDRYSFKINFGKYVDGQTYYGLDKLNLNNIYSDATYLKDYLSYSLFNYMDVDAPLASFISVTINGESWGLYLAVEEVSDSFLERTDNSEGDLYKPETDSLDNVGMGHGDMGEAPEMPEGFDGEMPEMPEGFDGEMPDLAEGEAPQMTEGTDGERPEMPEGADGQGGGPGGNGGPGGDGGSGGFGSDDSGASLKYTDDEADSYSDIFDNAETEVTEEDQERLIAALKNLSEGDVEDSVNIDSVINYFVVHNFVLNYDSYTGTMLHNYYLYEEDGLLQMIPWDYNLAFGAFMNQGGGPGNDSESSDATEAINYGIDSPLSGAEESDRPMWAWIAENDEYLEQYHEEFEKLISYVTSDEFTAELQRLYEMIYPYVESDATAFYTVDEFKTAFSTLQSFISLRAESIQKQLDGELSTITDEQDESARVDASSITISDMGTQGGGAHDHEPDHETDQGN